ncbi:MAG TPA: hypothetical protein PLP30_12440 [Clostridia bacterium]|nr:hypothetical protein [Clostridia bacterium]HRX42629.1 hypothetical protein [Clostridia bacterium]
MTSKIGIIRLLSILVALLLLFTSCETGDETSGMDASAKPSEAAARGTDEPSAEPEVTVEPVVTAAPQETQQAQQAAVKDFLSIEEFTDLLDEATDRLDDASDSVDSFWIMGDIMFLYQVGLVIDSAVLEHSLNGSRDTYVSEIKDAPNGLGKYSSSITEDEGSYFFGYDIEYNDGGTHSIKMSYVPEKGTISAETNSSDGEVMQANFYKSDDGFFVSYGIGLISANTTSQLLLYSNSDEVHYAIKTVDGIMSEPLPVAVFDLMPESWEELADGFEFTRMLSVVNGEAKYIEQ